MALLLRFGPDIFVSYSHIDNVNGWVTELHRLLNERVSQILGEQITIWRDKKVGGATDLWNEIFKHLKNAAVLISVLSPSYCRSESCGKELTEFQNTARKNIGIRVENKLRIVKVVKTPLDDDRHRQILSETLGFEFYRREEQSSGFREFNLKSKAYSDKLESLAQEIAGILHSLRTKETVYLAETAPDLANERKKISNEFLAQRYRVIPESAALESPKDPNERLAWATKQAGLSIHLIGPSYDRFAMIQYEEAKKQNLSRVVCVFKQKAPWDREQEEFLQRLRDEQTGQDEQDRLDLIEGRTTEQLKDNLCEILKASIHAPLVRERILYLLCDRKDHPLLCQEENNAARLKTYFMDEEGFEVDLPIISAMSTREANKDHREKLKHCCAVVLYWGSASEDWLRKKLLELSKPIVSGGIRNLISNTVYITDPRSTPKTNFETEKFLVIKQFGGFSAHALLPLLALFHEKGGAAHA